MNQLLGAMHERTRTNCPNRDFALCLHICLINNPFPQACLLQLLIREIGVKSEEAEEKLFLGRDEGNGEEKKTD